MKNQKKIGTQSCWLCVITIGTLIISLAACATTMPIESVRTPTIDTSGIQRLAIGEFQNKSGVGGQVAAQVQNELTNQSRQIITNAGKFTIVAAADPNAEGVFSGEITGINVNQTQEQGTRKDKAGNITNYTVYKREVALEFSYGVISKRTGISVGIVNKRGSQSASAEQQGAVTSEVDLARRIIASQLSSLQRDIVPTMVTTNQKLMKETSKDKTVKALMKTAESLVKNKQYEEAVKQFDAIAAEHKSAAARANANIIRGALANNDAARAQLAALYNDTSGLAEKAAKGAVDALNSKLPSRANIMIAITSSRERSMLDYVVDQMTKTVVQEGKLNIVERSNLALINAEQQYQTSGNVSDDSFVSIGKQLGAQYIVLCGISGEMSLRRLTLRVLNVETAQVIDQKDFEI